MIETKTLILPKTKHYINSSSQDCSGFHKTLEEIVLIYALLDKLYVSEDIREMENKKIIYYSFKKQNPKMSFQLYVIVNKLPHDSNHGLAGCFYLEECHLSIFYDKNNHPKIISELENTSLERIYSLNSNRVKYDFQSVGDDAHLILIKALKKELIS